MASVLRAKRGMASTARWQRAPLDADYSGESPDQEARAPRWDLLRVCVAVYVATAVGRVHELFPILLPLKPALLSAIVAMGLYLLQPSSRWRFGLLRSSTTTCVLGLAFWGALTVPLALNRGLAFQSWTDFARTILMSLVVAASVRGTRDVERLLLVYFGATALYTGVVLSRFHLGGGSNWRLDNLYTYDSNDLATLITTAMPLGLYFVVGRRRRPWLRVLAGIGLAVLAVGLIRSGSRGGFLAFLAVTAFVLLRVTTIPARSRLAALLVVLAFVFGTASDKYWSQMSTIVNPKQDYNMTSNTGRIQIWKRGIGYMLGQPMFGVGMKNFQVAEGTISPRAKLQERGVGVWWGAAHNSYVQAGAELGIPGVLFFLGMFATAFASLRRTARRALGMRPAGNDVSRLAQTLMAALVGFAVGAVFLSLAYADMLYMLMGFTIALLKAVRLEGARERALLA